MKWANLECLVHISLIRIKRLVNTCVIISWAMIAMFTFKIHNGKHILFDSNVPLKHHLKMVSHFLARLFILLIERSPADMWVSLIALAFVIRAVIKKDFAFLNVFWVKMCFAFLAVCFTSSVFSTIPIYLCEAWHGSAFHYCHGNCILARHGQTAFVCCWYPLRPVCRLRWVF